MTETTLKMLPIQGWIRSLLWAIVLLCAPLAAVAQVTYPLGSSGVMGLGSPNGEFVVAQDDLIVKVPGGHVRINRDYDGSQWVFNRQWSGLGDPSFNKRSYRSLGSFSSCTVIGGISSCDTTASAGQGYIAMQPIINGVRVPNDPTFGRDAEGRYKLQSDVQFIARKGVGFVRSTDGSAYTSAKNPRFLVRPQQVPTLPASAGPDAHPTTGKPGSGGLATTLVDGYRWTDRSGQWIEYDQAGRIASYGDRNDVRVWFQYGNHGQIERVLDDNGRTVFTFLYKDNGQFITEARDHTPVGGGIRRVQYFYTSNGYLNRVVDARGGETRFGYGRSTGGGLLGDNDMPDSGNSVYSIVRVTDAEARALNVEYGPTERISKITAPDGGVTEIGYDYDKLRKEFSTTIKYPQVGTDRKVEISRYDAEGRLVHREVGGKVLLTAKSDLRRTSYMDARGGTVTVARDTFDEVTSKTNSDGSTLRYVYDSSSLDLKEIVDEAGTSTKMNYDSSGNLTRLSAAVGTTAEQVTEYAVNARGEPETVTLKGGQRTDGAIDPDIKIGMTYDVDGNIREMVDGEGKVWRYEYDTLGNMTRALDPLNHEWRYTYDENGNRLSDTDPNGSTTRYSYDATDRLLTISDPRGQTHRLAYDVAGRPNSVIDPMGAATTIEYDAAGRLIRNRDAASQQVQYAYDVLDRLVSTTDGNEDVTTFSYAESDGVDRGAGLATTIQYPTYRQLLRYNSRQGLTQVADVVDGATRTTQLDYDALGSIRSTINAYGKSQAAQHDALGRPISGTNELGHTVQLAYDRRGNLVKVTDPLGHAIRLEYDGRGKLVRETNAENQATIYIYDDAGRLSEVQRPNGFRLVFTFDAGGRLQQRRSFRPDGSLELTDSFSWDNGNRLIAWTSGTSSSASTYDDVNRLLGETVTVDGVSMTRQYTYHPNGQVRTYTGPDGVTLTYAYDGNGGLDRIDIPGEGSMSVTERQWLEAKMVVLPGGTTQEITRDGLLNPTQLRVRGPGQSLLFEQTSSYGVLDEVHTRTTQGRAMEYSYDDALRLVEADPSSGTTETFQLDAAGNRVNDGRQATSWQYDDANRLLQRGPVAYQYDTAGNLIRKTDTSLPEPRRSTQYTYDGYNRLIEVRNGNNETVARYAYDPFGRRLSKDITSVGESTTGAAAGKRVFLQAEEGLLAEMSDAGILIQSYGWHPEGLYSTSPFFLRNSTGYFYYHNDPLGQPRQVTSKGGVVVWEANSVSSFGATSVVTGATIEQPWRLPGQYFDPETELHYNLHRYYDAHTGRYVTSDPAGLLGGTNSYAYGESSPTRYVDPYGLWVSFPDSGTGFWNNAADLTFGSFYFLTNGWTPPDWLSNGAAGWGDSIWTIPFTDISLTRELRNSAGIGNINVCSDAYRNGGYLGDATTLLAGGYGGIRSAGKAQKGLEFSHSIADRYFRPLTIKAGRPNPVYKPWLDKALGWAKDTILNGNYVTPMRHYLHDPKRFPRGWKNFGERLPRWQQLLDRMPRAVLGPLGGASWALSTDNVPDDACECK